MNIVYIYIYCIYEYSVYILYIYIYTHCIYIDVYIFIPYRYSRMVHVYRINITKNTAGAGCEIVWNSQPDDEMFK